MAKGFVKIDGQKFLADGKEILLRGYGIGNWLNLEHFMIGLPGTEKQLRSIITDTYGAEKAKAFWNKYYECYVGEADFKFLKNLGVNAVRIPFNYRQFESDQAPYQYDDSGFEQIDRVLGLCEKYEIYAILDMHSVPGGQNPDWHSDNSVGEPLFWEFADFRNRTTALWQHIAKRYRKNTWIAAYDLMNEASLSGPAGNLVADFYENLAKEVRKIDKNHVFFYEGDFYSQDFRSFCPSKDPGIAYSFHTYPFGGYHKMSAEEKKAANGATLEETIHHLDSSIMNNFEMKDIKEKMNRPFWCGETGISYDADNNPLYEKVLEASIAVFEKNNISWTLWCYKDANRMGTVHIKPDSGWKALMQEAGKGWSFNRELDDCGVEAEELIKKLSAVQNDQLKRKIQFRNAANTHIVLAERMREAFKSIPYERLMKAVESFRFENCAVWEAIAGVVKKYSK